MSFSALGCSHIIRYRVLATIPFLFTLPKKVEEMVHYDLTRLKSRNYHSLLLVSTVKSLKKDRI